MMTKKIYECRLCVSDTRHYNPTIGAVTIEEKEVPYDTIIIKREWKYEFGPPSKAHRADGTFPYYFHSDFVTFILEEATEWAEDIIVKSNKEAIRKLTEKVNNPGEFVNIKMLKDD